MKNRSLLQWFLLTLLSAFLLGSPGTQSCLAADSVPAPMFLDRAQGGAFALRVMSWNVWLSSIFPPDGVRCESFARIVKAVNPDILCLQEIDPRRAGTLAGMMDRFLPLKEGLHWQAQYATNIDNVVLSRYPLLRRAQEPVMPRPLSNLYLGQVMCLVDLPDSLDLPDLYVIATHFKSSSDEASIRARQRHADSLVRWLRLLRQPSHPDFLPARTPILILGDLNVYEADPRDVTHHLTTLLTGNIVDEKTFGPAIKPDWDDSYLLEVKPRHNGRDKDWYTWRVDTDRFAPGALDRIIYTDSVMEPRSGFVLNTTTMTEEELSRHGLLATDVLKGGKPGNFDHLPLVADFVLLAKSF